MNPVQQLVGYIIIGNFILKIVFDFQYDSSSVFWFLEVFFSSFITAYSKLLGVA